VKARDVCSSGLRVIVAAALALSLAACSATTASPHHKVAPRDLALVSSRFKPLPVSTAHFYAIWSVGPYSAKSVIEEFSARNGRPIRMVAKLRDSSGWGSGGLIQGPDGWIWYSESKGPLARGRGAGGNPEPNSCGGAAMKMNPQNGQSFVVFRTPPSVSFSGVVPSPSGRYVVYETGQCNRSYFNTYFVVRDLVTGRRWSIGADAGVCHGFSAPAWTSDGRFIFGYAPSLVRQGQAHEYGYGFCLAPAQPELAVISATSPTSIRSATLMQAPRHCGYLEAVPDAWGVLALKACALGGAGPYNDIGATALVQLNAHFKVTGRWNLPPGQDGTSLAASPNGRLILIDEYEAPGHYGLRTVRQPLDYVEVFNGSRLHLVTRVLDAKERISEAIW
jgi:hypothetical protein